MLVLQQKNLFEKKNMTMMKNLSEILLVLLGMIKALATLCGSVILERKSDCLIFFKDANGKKIPKRQSEIGPSLQRIASNLDFFPRFLVIFR